MTNDIEMPPFHILRKSSLSLARAGVFRFDGATSTTPRTPLQTPTFIIPTSRGVVPHLSPDNVASGLSYKPALYVGAEDFLEKLPADPPIFGFPSESPSSAREFMCLPSEIPIIASVRRSLPVAISTSNRDTSVGVMTAEGCRDMPLEKFYEFVAHLGPDIVLACPDFTYNSKHPGGNRIRKMVFRTERWFEDLLKALDKSTSKPQIFAPVLPIDLRSQGNYLDFLQSQTNRISGLTFWTSHGNALEKANPPLTETWENTLAALEQRQLSNLPRYNTAGVFQTPFEILSLIATGGIDIFNGDMATSLTEAGVALDFTFPAPVADSPPLLGFNLWEPQYKTDTSGFGVNTPDFCAPHNRAYINHLLDAHEMTAWVLLQKHNLNVLGLFFEGIRKSIESNTFEQECERFKQVYGDQDLHELRDRCKAQGPNIRSYSR